MLIAEFKSYSITTPIHVQQLKNAALGYPDRDFLIKGFMEGFRLGVRSNCNLVNRLWKPRHAPMPLLTKLKDEVLKGRIIGPFQVKPMDDLFISPLCVIPKPDSNKMRMIFNLSYPPGRSVNDNIEERYRTVSYCSVQEVGEYLLENYPTGAWAAKIDLEDAYRMVPIHQDDWKFLGINVEGRFYVDRMLPMGASSSCQLFQRISDGLKEIFLTSTTNAKVFNYLDDFLFISGSKEQCDASVKTFEVMCKNIGVPIANHKTIRACQSITFLGLGLNTKDLSVYIPEEKRKKTLKKLDNFLQKNDPKVKQWQSIAGSLSHVSQVLRAGRTYLGGMYGGLAGILSQRGNVRRKLTSEVKEDLTVWQTLLKTPPYQPFKLLKSNWSPHPPLFTDASTSIGYGATWGTQWFYGNWPTGTKNNIATLELYPIYMALLMLGDRVCDTVIKVFTDNMALVSVINKLYSRDKSLRRLLKPITQLCLKQNLHIRAYHIPGVKNRGPDMLSRGLIKEFQLNFPSMDHHPQTIPIQLLPQNSLHL